MEVISATQGDEKALSGRLKMYSGKRDTGCDTRCGKSWPGCQIEPRSWKNIRAVEVPGPDLRAIYEPAIERTSPAPTCGLQSTAVTLNEYAYDMDVNVIVNVNVLVSNEWSIINPIVAQRRMGLDRSVKNFPESNSIHCSSPTVTLDALPGKEQSTKNPGTLSRSLSCSYVCYFAIDHARDLLHTTLFTATTSQPIMGSIVVSTDSYTIRPALSTDVATILRLVNELADYEHALHEVHATEASLKQSLSFPDTDKISPPTFGSRVARTLLICPKENSEEVAGMALYFHNYSTWRSTAGIYLEDLYVSPTYRGRGFGKALLQALAKQTLESCGENARLDWSVLKWNQPSIDFYESQAVGATMMKEWVGMRVDGDKLKKLAGMA